MTALTFIEDYDNNRFAATFDVGELVREWTKRIVAAEEGAIEGVLLRAFSAGMQRQKYVTGVSGFELPTPDWRPAFDEWLEILKEEVRGT